MNFGTFAGFLLTLFLGIITTYFIVTSNLDKIITNKIKDPEFLRTIVEQVRIPFLIFDENNTHIVDGGGAKYISRISISKDDRGNITEIILTLSKKMHIAPILVGLNNDTQFYPATPEQETGWKYKALQYDVVVVGTTAETPPAKVFKLDIFDQKN